MIIKFSRIDDRLIHGQVTTVWSKEANAKRIIICNDEIFNNALRTTLLKQAAPPGIKVNVVSIEKAVSVYHNPAYADETVFFLFTNPTDVLRLVKQGVAIEKLNIGGMAYQEGKHQITKSVSVDQKDIEAFQELHAHHVALDLRVVSSDPSVNFIHKINQIAI